MAASYVIPIGQLDCWALGGLLALNIKEKGKSNVVMFLEITLGILGIVGLTIYNAFLSGCSIGESYQLWHSSGGYVHNILTGNIHFVIALLSVGILRFCIDTTRHHPILSSAPLVALGGMTYELYCFHYPIKVFVKHLIQNDYLMVIAALIATCIVTLLWSRYAMPVFKKIIK